MSVIEMPAALRVANPTMHGEIDKAAAYVVVAVDLDGSIRAFTNLRRSGDLDRIMLKADPMLYAIVEANRGRK